MRDHPLSVFRSHSTPYLMFCSLFLSASSLLWPLDARARSGGPSCRRVEGGSLIVALDVAACHIDCAAVHRTAPCAAGLRSVCSWRCAVPQTHRLRAAHRPSARCATSPPLRCAVAACLCPTHFAFSVSLARTRIASQQHSLTMHARMRMAAVAAVMAMALVAAAVAPAAAHLHTNPLSKINVAGVKMQLGTGVR